MGKTFVKVKGFHTIFDLKLDDTHFDLSTFKSGYDSNQIDENSVLFIEACPADVNKKVFEYEIEHAGICFTYAKHKLWGVFDPGTGTVICEIKYITDGGNYTGTDTDLFTTTEINSGGNHTVKSLPSDTVLKKDGYTLTNGKWKCGSTTYNSGQEIQNITSSITFKPIWTPKTYTIEYKDKGGSAFTGNHQSGYPTTHTYGTTTLLKSPSKTGYIFGGWYSDSNCTTQISQLTGKPSSGDTFTVYAKWNEELHDYYSYDIPASNLNILKSKLASGNMEDLTICPNNVYSSGLTDSSKEGSIVVIFTPVLADKIQLIDGGGTNTFGSHETDSETYSISGTTYYLYIMFYNDGDGAYASTNYTLKINQ